MLKFAVNEPSRLETRDLIENLLGCDASTVASSGEQYNLLGVAAFMRRVLELAIHLTDRRQVSLHLETENAAQAGQWPNAQVSNLATLFVWSLLQQRRRLKGLPLATLDGARDVPNTPVRIGRRLRAMSIDELVAELEKPIVGNFVPSIPVDSTVPIAMIKSMLRLDAERLRHYRDDADSGLPECLDGAGLDDLIRDALAQYKVMRERGATAIRLMNDEDAKDVAIPGARPAQIAALLAGSLHAADGKHDVFFLAPRNRSAADKAALKQTAKLVYRDYSDEALRGLEGVCDGCVHFGHGKNFTIAERLLREAAKDCDPDLQRMPYCVSLQVTIEMLGSLG